MRSASGLRSMVWALPFLQRCLSIVQVALSRSNSRHRMPVNFSAPLSCQKQELEHVFKGPTQFARCLPKGFDFFIIEKAVASLRREWSRIPSHWIASIAALFNAQAKIGYVQQEFARYVLSVRMISL